MEPREREIIANMNMRMAEAIRSLTECGIPPGYAIGAERVQRFMDGLDKVIRVMEEGNEHVNGYIQRLRYKEENRQGPEEVFNQEERDIREFLDRIEEVIKQGHNTIESSLRRATPQLRSEILKSIPFTCNQETIGLLVNELRNESNEKALDAVRFFARPVEREPQTAEEKRFGMAQSALLIRILNEPSRYISGVLERKVPEISDMLVDAAEFVEERILPRAVGTHRKLQDSLSPLG